MINEKNSFGSKISRKKRIRFKRTDKSMMLLSDLIRKYHDETDQPLSKIELRKKRTQAAAAMEEAAQRIQA